MPHHLLRCRPAHLGRTLDALKSAGIPTLAPYAPDGLRMLGSGVLVELPDLERYPGVWHDCVEAGGAGEQVNSFLGGGDPVVVPDGEVAALRDRCSVDENGRHTLVVDLPKATPLAPGDEVIIWGDDGYGTAVEHGRAVIVWADPDGDLLKLRALQGPGITLWARVQQVERAEPGNEGRRQGGLGTVDRRSSVGPRGAIKRGRRRSRSIYKPWMSDARLS